VLADSNGLQSALVWLFGDLSQARLKGAAFSAAGVFLATLLIWGQWRSLDALLIGEEGAESVGIDVGSARRKIIFLSSILIGLCVSAGGMIGFVGLIVPHLARRWVGSLHLALIPLCAMLGAVVLTTADWMSRILLKPYELPVGVVTALIGAPVFLWIMLKNQRHV
jgi:iron complex transport system permease protein